MDYSFLIGIHYIRKNTPHYEETKRDSRTSISKSSSISTGGLNIINSPKGDNNILRFSNLISQEILQKSRQNSRSSNLESPQDITQKRRTSLGTRDKSPERTRTPLDRNYSLRCETVGFRNNSENVKTVQNVEIEPISVKSIRNSLEHSLTFKENIPKIPIAIQNSEQTIPHSRENSQNPVQILPFIQETPQNEENGHVKERRKDLSGGILSCTSDIIYYFGIIDYLVEYDFYKQMETFAKLARAKRDEISSVSPDDYASRFKNYLEKNFGLQRLHKKKNEFVP